jgi:hypothetical protein
MALASDIVCHGARRPADYVHHCMEPALFQARDEGEPPEADLGGYSLGTALALAAPIAEEIEARGYITFEV